ncbi:ribosomal protein L11 methyltransferase [Legionella impletisoli]|uniref:Ribosomal protein L11 methyltransferase n=1 Tax=Legionella impletisoli TaxID=343510 RepID=A0A917NBT1_9GAMM|nr:50S ribosomal protein L11 methyltransferase [Legionella impletisoli]GGI86447.1 ribosomal protein L11 methyltransferase [Legionella impletisoli]
MLQLQIECHRDDVEELSDFLEETGALSITFTDKYDDPILEPELGTTPLWSNVIIQALYEKQEDAEHASSAFNTQYPKFLTSLAAVPEEDWERVWMTQFTPLQFGRRLWIVPSWITPPDPNACNLILDPGLAFGTGTHPTTSLCLTWLDNAELVDKRVVDYGCGSGILALAAIKLGAKHVYAVDIDEQALMASRNNAEMNQVPSELISVCFPDELQLKTDLIMANILLTPLLSLKMRFYHVLEKEGMLVVSGILVDQTQELIEAYQDCFKHESTTTREEWALVTFKAI